MFYDDNDNVKNSSLYVTKSADEYGDEYKKNIFGDTKLKTGIVVKTYETDDKDNQSKNFVEYDVLVLEQTENSTEPVFYRNCTCIESFGGLADFFEYKLRPQEEKKQKNTPLDVNFKTQDGSVVLLLCLDGSTDKGIIVNSVAHPGRKTTLTPENGVHLEGEYNGVNWQVNKDGELTVTFKSKTNIKGEPQDENAGGTTIKMDKTGSVEVNTNIDDATLIKLDKENKDLNIEVGNNVSMKAKTDIAMAAEAKITGSAKGSLELSAEGTAKVTSKSTLDLEGKAKVGIKSDTVMINGSNLVQIDTQKTMINSAKVFVGQGGTPAVIATTKFVGTGNHGAPVTCSAVGPFSSSVFIAT